MCLTVLPLHSYCYCVHMAIIEGLNEVGADVLDLLEFFISRYKHVNEANFLLEGPEEEAITVHGNLT